MTKNKGVALILSVIILTAVLVIALTAGKVFTDKLKMSRNTSDSMKAYYAAESGVEWALYQYKTTGVLPTCNPSCTATIDGAEYEIKIVDGAIKAIGKAGEARRGIEVALATAGLQFGVIPASDTTLDGDCDAGGYTASTGFAYDSGSGLIILPGSFSSVGYEYIQCYE